MMRRMRPLACLVALTVTSLAAAPPQTFRAGVSLVRVPVVVTGRDGAFVRGLAKDDFQVLEDGRPQPVQLFQAGGESSAGEDSALHVGLLLDISGSMVGDLAQAATAAVRFVNALEEAVDVTLVDFDDQVRVARFQPAQYERLFERIRSRKAGGNTALYDAIAMYLQSEVGQDGQKVLLLYTDGGDSTSALGYGQLLRMLKTHDVLVYSIGYLNRMNRMGQAQMQLSEMARQTGGDAFFPEDVRDLNAIYAKILDELGSRYTLGYLPPNPVEDGKWRKIEVKLTRPELQKSKVRARLGYFAGTR
ncbi:MAG: VWA domain-containing protein [Acidobacteria bacterium]|nr:MAG: VWA domain-containing protein [Acidobacteriota bacterium]